MKIKDNKYPFVVDQQEFANITGNYLLIQNSTNMLKGLNLKRNKKIKIKIKIEKKKAQKEANSIGETPSKLIEVWSDPRSFKMAIPIQYIIKVDSK